MDGKKSTDIEKFKKEVLILKAVNDLKKINLKNIF